MMNPKMIFLGKTFFFFLTVLMYYVLYIKGMIARW